MATLTLALGLWLMAVTPAWATEGKPTGWSVDQATQVERVGRMELRYEPQLADEARVLVREAPRWWSEIEAELSGDVDDTVRIIFVEHSGGVARASGMPTWAAGVAHPPTGQILIARHGPDGAPSNLEELLRHEMAHVILHRATGGAELPRWFHEGVAESFNGTINFGRSQTLASAVFGPGVPNLEHLEESFYGTDGPQASVAYAAARDLVEYMRTEDGTGMSLRQVLTELRAGKSFEVAVIRAYDASLEEIVAEWRKGLPGRFMWYPIAASGGLPFILVAPLVAIAWIRRRRAVARGYRRLELEDRELFAPAHSIFPGIA